MTPFNQFTVYDIEGLPSNEMLEIGAFRPCGPLDRETSGWVPVEHGAFIAHRESNAFMSFMIETKIMPPATIRRMANELADAIEKDTGERPRGKKFRELTEQVLDTVCATALTARSTFGVWIDGTTGRVAIGTAAPSKADVIARALRDTEQLTLTPTAAKWAPGEHMRSWVATGTAPLQLALQDDVTLYAEGSQITYKSVDLEDAEIRKNVGEGMRVKSIGMRFNDRVGFTLGENGAFSKIDLDYDQDDDGSADEDKLFKTTLMALEYRPLIASVSLALAKGE